MKAVCIHAYGGPDTLVYEDAPRPQPGEGEALVRIRAAGVNPVDWKMRQGASYPLPFILGWDVVGVVEELGAGASGVASGEAVYTMRDWEGGGAYAEYIAVRADELAPLRLGILSHLPQAQSRQAEAGNRDPLVQEPGADLPNRQMLERRDTSGDLALAVGLPRDQFAQADQDPRARGPRH